MEKEIRVWKMEKRGERLNGKGEKQKKGRREQWGHSRRLKENERERKIGGGGKGMEEEKVKDENARKGERGKRKREDKQWYTKRA